MKIYRAVYTRWPYEPMPGHPVLDKAIRETGSDGCVSIVAHAGNATMARRIARLLNLDESGIDHYPEDQNADRGPTLTEGEISVLRNDVAVEGGE